MKVHVSVKAEGDKAKATVTYDGKNDAPTFTNKYQPAETSVALTAKKAYVKPDNTPATLKGGEFTFDLYEGDLTAEQLKGKQPIRSAKNSEDGTVTRVYQANEAARRAGQQGGEGQTDEDGR